MEEILKNIGVGKRSIDDPFFKESYEVCKVFQRKGIVSIDDEELCHEVMKEFSCSIAGCNRTFQTLIAFEMHYNNSHRYACGTCKVILPTARLLDIHIEETHDSFFKLLSQKKPMYQCYAAGCILKFNNPSDRYTHSVHACGFPKNLGISWASRKEKVKDHNKMEIDEVDFKQKNIKNNKVYLNKNQKIKMFMPASSKSVISNESTQAAQISTSVNKNTSSLMFIPQQIQKSYSKILTNNQSNERNVLENDNMMDIANALPD